MFTLLVLALVIAVLLQDDTEGVTNNQELLLSENHIENNVIDYDKFE